MAERFSVGSLAISVVPSLEGFTDQVRSRLLPEADTLGNEIGDVLTNRINEKLKDVRLRVGVDNTLADARLDQTRAKADELNGKKAEINVDVKNQSSVRAWLVSLVAGAVAIAPAFAVAGVGVAAFGALATPVLSGVVKYLQDMASGSAKAGQEWNSLTGDQKEMATELLQLKNEFHDLSFSLQPEVLQVFGAALEDIDRILPEIIPVAKAAGTAIADSLQTIGNGLDDADAEKFFQFVAQNVGPDLQQISVTVVALIHTIFSLTEAMQPLSLGLLHLVAGFADMLSALSKSAPWLDDIIILSIALYKPLVAIRDIQIAKAFDWIPKSIEGLRTFSATTLAAATVMNASETATAGFAVSAAGAAVAVDSLTVSERAAALAAGVLDAVSPWAWAAAGVVALGALIYAAHQSAEEITRTTDQIEQSNHATGLNAQGYLNAAAAIGRYNVQQSQATERLVNLHTGADGARVSLNSLDQAQGQLSDTQQKLITEGDNVNANLLELMSRYGLTSTQATQLALTQKGVVSAFKDGGDAAQTMQRQIAAYVQEQKLAHEPTNQFIIDLDGIANAALGATGQVKALTDAYNAMVAPNLTAEQNVVTMKNDLIDLKKALKDSKDAVGDHTATQRASFSAFATYIQDINNTAQSTINSTGAQRAHDLQVLHSSIPFLETLASKNANVRGEIDKLIKIILAIPKTENVKINVAGSGKWAIAESGGVAAGGLAPHAARGLFITSGTPGVDDQLIMAQKNELVVPPGIVASGAVDHLRGMIPGFASGGVVGSYSGTIPGTGTFVQNEDKATATAIEQSVASAISSGLKSLTSGSLPGGDLSAHGGSAAANQAIARALLPLFGFGADQMSYLIPLWNRESGWNQFADNPLSGAYGIPQSLPAVKMASAGADWRTNPVTQERWGLGYISGRYGSPAAAWQHELSAGWYDDGGWVPPGVSLMMNGTGSPEPVLSDRQWGMLQAATQGGDGGRGGDTIYNANFTMPGSLFESRVRTAFRAMDMENSLRERSGRRH